VIGENLCRFILCNQQTSGVPQIIWFIFGAVFAARWLWAAIEDS
jgi:hypothetical protein